MRSEMRIMLAILDIQKERDTYRSEVHELLSVPDRYRSKEARCRVDRLTSCIISCNDSVSFLKQQLNTYR